MDLEDKPNNDCHSLFVEIGAFYPHHVGYEIHSLSIEALGLSQKNGLGRAVQGIHTLNLEGITLVSDQVEACQACDITITDVSTYDIKDDTEDDRAYMGAIRLSNKGPLKAVINLKPSIVRDLLSYFYYRPKDANFNFNRPVVIRLDISTEHYGILREERFKIIRIALE